MNSRAFFYLECFRQQYTALMLIGILLTCRCLQQLMAKKIDTCVHKTIQRNEAVLNISSKKSVNIGFAAFFQFGTIVA